MRLGKAVGLPYQSPPPLYLRIANSCENENTENREKKTDAFSFIYISFTNATEWHATIAAVSVRNLVSPKVTGINLLFIANSISLREKSPSGPIKIVMLFSGLRTCFKDFLTVSSQWAINKSPL